MNIEAFIMAYEQELSAPEYLAVNPHYECAKERHRVAQKMTQSVLNDEHRHDWLKYNDAMRRAAKRFGIKTSKEFREAIKQSA
jgi:hypothetical protein